MTLTLTDHCSMTVLPFHEGSKDDKVGLKICFFALLHIWLCHVLSLYKDTCLPHIHGIFLSSRSLVLHVFWASPR